MITNPIATLLHKLDNAIDKYKTNLAIIDRDFVDENDRVLSREYSNYQHRRNTVIQRFKKEIVDIQYELDALCKDIRISQPELINLTAESIRKEQRFPSALALDKIRVQYSDLDFCVPRLIRFPFSHNIALPNSIASEQIPRLLLRMLYSLPCGKIVLHIFDPLNLGDSVRDLKNLLTESKLFPDKKILSSKKEARECLENAILYAENLIQSVFPSGCNSYTEYNSLQRKKNESKNTLPYHVYLFFDVPQNLDEPSMEMLSTLSGLSNRCGHLVITTYDPSVFVSEDPEGHPVFFDKSVQLLKKIITTSRGDEMFTGLKDDHFKHLKLSYALEHLPAENDLLNRIADLRRVYEDIANTGTSFADMNAGRKMFDCSSVNGLEIPIGFSDTSNSLLSMHLNDATPHYLIGGTTGSGKSNLLHILILSMCTRYSPNELEVYLLDFKDGVEFSAYASPTLPHARLVAMEADTEYGVSVLRYLILEKERRNVEFKKHKVKDIAGYRNGQFGKMPRIVVIIDEFQVLFSNEDKERTLENLNMLAKQGRSCGIHLVMATQSLTDVANFSDTQFGGRIALRCSADDSKNLMGGPLTNNEAASELKIPYAILNTENGKVAGNRKFAVPGAEQIISSAVEAIVAESNAINYCGKTDLFYGQKLPKHPDFSRFRNDESIRILLGESLEYPSREFSIRLESKGGHNIVICGNNDVFKKGLLSSISMSAAGCERIKRIVYIGFSNITEAQIQNIDISSYETTADWIRSELNNKTNSGTIIVLNGVNLHKEINLDPYAIDATEEVTFFKDFQSEGYKNDCFIIAFYERLDEFNDSGIDEKYYIHRIGYGMSNNDSNRFTGDYIDLPSRQSSRALYSCGGKFQGFFKPYGDEQL